VKVLVINCGSSSVKYQLIDTSNGDVLAKGIVERIGFDDAVFSHATYKSEKTIRTLPIKDHDFAIKCVLEGLVDKKTGVIDNLSDIRTVGHRFVNGGKYFQESTLVNEAVLDKISRVLDLAPLHNPAHLIGIKACVASMPDTPQVIVFDTSFHSMIPPEAYLYALPYEYYEKYGIRRYGFHGTSHFYVSSRAAQLLEKPYKEVKIITCHLGNGCSIDAVSGGHAVDTSMGFTPLEGLMMGTRTGDIDAAAILYIMKKEKHSPEEMDTIINKKSGLLGFTGVSSDIREILNLANEGNERARTAIDMYCYRIKKYISAYTGILGGADALVFTAGVGEHSPIIRAKACEGLSCIGIEIDETKNNNATTGETEISTDSSRVKIFVIPTNEEIVIAREAERLCAGSNA